MIQSNRVNLQGFVGIVVGLVLAAPVACSAAIDLDKLENGLCDEGSKDCNGVCVSTDSPSFGCGEPQCNPCSRQNAIANCDGAGRCAISSCQGNFRDCDLNPENGCEVDIAHDPNNCRTCGAVCETMNGVPACGDERCTLSYCFDGWDNCDGDFGNGCETNVSASPDHCGQCENACGDDEACIDGVCSSQT